MRLLQAGRGVSGLNLESSYSCGDSVKYSQLFYAFATIVNRGS